MSTVFFEGVLASIGKYIRYEAIANYGGNSFMKDSFKIIEDHFPLKKVVEETGSGIGNLFKGLKINNGAKNKVPDYILEARVKEGE